jgi:hypothetical protein
MTRTNLVELSTKKVTPFYLVIVTLLSNPYTCTVVDNIKDKLNFKNKCTHHDDSASPLVDLSPMKMTVFYFVHCDITNPYN